MMGAAWIPCLLVLLYSQRIQSQSVRLWRGGANDGLLQVYINESFVIGCSNSQAFSTNDANILCRGLGKPNGHSVIVDYNHYLVGNETLETVSTVLFKFHCQGTESSFSECIDASSIELPSEIPCINGIGVLCSNQAPAFRISSIIPNRIEMTANATTWVGICAESFTHIEAKVACKTLEKPWADARPLKIRNKLSHDPVVRDIRCLEGDDTFVNCSGFVYGYHECPEAREAGVFCGHAKEYQFRLMDGPSLSIGRIEMFHKTRWGTVCNRGQFTRATAQVVCKSLGFQYTTARVVPIKNYFTDEGFIWLKDPNCTGYEENLRQCDHHFNGEPVQPPCSHQDDVAISCESHRLEGSPNSGELQVSYEGSWFNVIGDSFDRKAATVVCRALNQERSGVEFSIIQSNDNQVDDMLEITSCVPSMSSLMDCHREWVDPVSLKEDNITVTQVQVTCKAADSSRVQFRHPGNDMLGLYEVFDGTDWGTICSAGLGEEEVQIACRHLGYGSSFATIFPPTIRGNGSVILDGITCSGSESSFSQCVHNPFGVVSCDIEHRDDLNIYCGEKEDNFDVRLVGDQSNAGRAEVKLYGSWGTVCDDGFDFNAAKVICRQLNLPIFEPRTTSIFPVGGNDKKIWLHGVNCTGDEDSIQDCLFKPILGPTTCTHAEDIGVVCSGDVVNVSDGLSGGAIAGIVIAVLLVFAILIVALCIGIRVWSAARRDLGSNLLKTDPKSSGGTAQYNSEEGLVNMAFNDSPNTPRNGQLDGKAYNEPAKVPHVAMGSYEPYKARHLSQTPDVYANTQHADSNVDIPPAYHTLDLQSAPSYDNPPRSSVSSHGHPITPRSEQPGYPAPRPIIPASPNYQDPPEKFHPQSYPRHDETGDDFGFSSNNSSHDGKGYTPPNRSYSSEGPSRIAGRQTRPHYSTVTATADRGDNVNSDNPKAKGLKDNSANDRQHYGNQPSYKNTVQYNDPRSNPQDLPSPRYRAPRSAFQAGPSQRGGEDATVDLEDRVPEGTSV